jgi:exonuclease III
VGSLHAEGSEQANRLSINGDVCSLGNSIKICTWNVEGLTELKVHQICRYMAKHSIGICCMQETHKSMSRHFFAEGGFKVILSGRAGNDRECAGVGFIVSPQLTTSIVGFCQLSNRVASLKVRIVGGTAAVFSAYAPHNLKSLGQRIEFYERLSDAFLQTRVNGPKLILGDFNARIGDRRPGEDSALGEVRLCREAVHQVEVPNRDLLLEFCLAHQLAVANSFFNFPAEKMVTFCSPGVEPKSEATHNGFAILDLLLVPSQWLPGVSSYGSDRNFSFASHHFPVTFSSAIELQQSRVRPEPKLDWGALADVKARTEFAKRVTDACGDGTDVPTWEHCCKNVQDVAKELLPPTTAAPRKPWISAATLWWVRDTHNARERGDFQEEKRLRKETRKSARRDRAAWLTGVAAKGDWNSIAKLRKGPRKLQGRLCDVAGNFVSSEAWPETFS